MVASELVGHKDTITGLSSAMNYDHVLDEIEEKSIPTPSHFHGDKTGGLVSTAAVESTDFILLCNAIAYIENFARLSKNQEITYNIIKCNIYI